MENYKKSEKISAFQSMNNFFAEDRGKILLSLSLAVGIIMGSITCAIYGSNAVNSHTIHMYCTNPTESAIQLIAVTVGFIIILSIFGSFKVTRWLIYPAVCFRGLGLGSLICGILQASGIMGLCFTALVAIPYAVINSALAVYAGEFSLGIRLTFDKNNTALTKGLILHTLKIFAAYLIISALSCGIFVISCLAFAKYLM